jgi:hypothetical protein
MAFAQEQHLGIQFRPWGDRQPQKVNALAGGSNKDRKQWSDRLYGPAHERLATKPSSCGWKKTVYVHVGRESCTFLCAYGLLAEHRFTVGTIEKYKTEAHALKAAEGMRLMINDGITRPDPVLFCGLLDRFLLDPIQVSGTYYVNATALLSIDANDYGALCYVTIASNGLADGLYGGSDNSGHLEQASIADSWSVSAGDAVQLVCYSNHFDANTYFISGSLTATLINSSLAPQKSKHSQHTRSPKWCRWCFGLRAG